MGAFSASINRSFNQRIGIFIDVQNMFYSAKLLHSGKIDYGELLREVTGDRQLVRAIAYIVQKAEVDQTSFLDAMERFGYDLRVKELKIRADNTVKGNWDVGIAVDALTLADKLDVVVLVTGDGVFVPLVEALRRRGCRVEIYSFDGSTAADLIRAADQYICIPEHVVFKDRRFEEQNANNQFSKGNAYRSEDPHRMGVGQYFHDHNDSRYSDDEDDDELDEDEYDDEEELDDFEDDEQEDNEDYYEESAVSDSDEE